MTSEAQTPSVEPDRPATLLFVDDEANILAALKRLFRPQGYHVLTSVSAGQGLELLERQPVDLVISDMRMPEMDGVQFLEQVRLKWPHAIRILLTGYADMASTVAAINRGEIHRYIAKPWEDTDILLAVQHALDRQRLQAQKERLEQLTRQQNDQLKALNASLEAKVQARTQELRQALRMLETAHADLKKGYIAAVKVFANLIELREGGAAGHGRRVAEHARNVARALGLTGADVQDILFAGLLHDIGKIGLPDAIVNRPFVALSSQERAQVMQHPVIGETALLGLDALQGAARLIRGHHERFDGEGYPDRLAGEEIPLGARILTVVNDYEALQAGTLVEGELGPEEARAFLIAHRGQRYDPSVIDTFLPLLDQAVRHHSPVKELRLASMDLREGMILSRDLINTDGMLLLSKGQTLKAGHIDRIRDFEQKHNRGYTLYVCPEEGDVDA